MKKILSLLLAVLLLAGTAAAEDKKETKEKILEPQWEVQNQISWLLDVAREELGYTEDHGYTKYGEWAGDPYAQWCAEFLCWCVDQVDQRYGTHMLKEQYPLYSGQNTGRNWFIHQGRYVSRNGYLQNWGYQWFPDGDSYLSVGDYIPQPGDWVFFTFTSDSDTDHVAMVEYCSEDEKGRVTIHVIEGNAPSSVQRTEYALTDARILGYGTVNDVVDVTLMSGYSGVKVTKLQNKLFQLGLLEESDVTGNYGSATKNAVRLFQQAHGLKINGIANMATQQALDAALEDQFYNTPSNWIVNDDD